MKNRNGMRTTGAISTLFACALILAQPALLRAQSRKPIPPSPSGESETKAPPRDMRGAAQATMEMQILMSRRWAAMDMERERRRIAGQLNIDLERIVQIEAERIGPVSSAKSIDYRTLAQAAAEIRDRAVQIKYAFPVALKNRGEKIRLEADPTRLGSMLPELSRAIKNFIGNPVLRENSPNDAALRSTAGHDLESIIKLSGTINKIAKTLNKSLVASK